MRPVPLAAHSPTLVPTRFAAPPTLDPARLAAPPTLTPTRFAACMTAFMRVYVARPAAGRNQMRNAFLTGVCAVLTA